MFLFHSDARSFIGQYERGGSSPPFYIGLRTTRWLKFIGDKPNYTAGEKKERKKLRHLSRESSSRPSMEPFDGMMILTKRGEKTAYFPFSFIVLENVTSVEGELRKKTWFFNLPVARTWLHAYVCKAGVRRASKVGRIRRTNDRARSRISTAIRTTLVSPEKTLKLQLFLINEMVIGVTAPPPRSIGIIS